MLYSLSLLALKGLYPMLSSPDLPRVFLVLVLLFRLRLSLWLLFLLWLLLFARFFHCVNTLSRTIFFMNSITSVSGFWSLFFNMLTILTFSILLGGLGLTIGLGVLFRGWAPLLLLISFHLQVKEWFLYIVYLYFNTSVMVDSLNHGFKDTEQLERSDRHLVVQYTLYLFSASDHWFFA